MTLQEKKLPDWLGLVIIAFTTLLAFVIAALVFRHEMSLEVGSSIIRWCLLPWCFGFILHMISVSRRRKDRKK